MLNLTTALILTGTFALAIAVGCSVFILSAERVKRLSSAMPAHQLARSNDRQPDRQSARPPARQPTTPTRTRRFKINRNKPLPLTPLAPGALIRMPEDAVALEEIDRALKGSGSPGQGR